MHGPIFCELLGIRAEDALSSPNWRSAKKHMRAEFKLRWPGLKVNQSVYEEVRNLGSEGRQEVVTYIKWIPSDG